MEINGVFYRTFSVATLFFRYIRGTELQAKKVTPEELAEQLEKLNFIKLNEDRTRYAELPTFIKHSGRWDFQKLWRHPNGALHGIFNTRSPS